MGAATVDEDAARKERVLAYMQQQAAEQQAEDSYEWQSDDGQCFPSVQFGATLCLSLASRCDCGRVGLADWELLFAITCHSRHPHAEWRADVAHPTRRT